MAARARALRMWAPATSTGLVARFRKSATRATAASSRPVGGLGGHKVGKGASTKNYRVEGNLDGLHAMGPAQLGCRSSKLATASSLGTETSAGGGGGTAWANAACCKVGAHLRGNGVQHNDLLAWAVWRLQAQHRPLHSLV